MEVRGQFVGKSAKANKYWRCFFASANTANNKIVHILMNIFFVFVLAFPFPGILSEFTLDTQFQTLSDHYINTECLFPLIVPISLLWCVNYK